MRLLLKKVWAFGKIAFPVLVCWALLLGVAFAAPQQGIQPKVEGEEVQSTTYVLAYFITILGIVSGLLFVCMPSKRRDRARPEVYGEAKTAAK
jgi:hypothetical protein